MIKLFYLNIDTVEANLTGLMGLLSQTSFEKAKSFHKHEDMLRYIAGRTLLKIVLGDNNVRYSPRGKPYILNGERFNLSHSGKYTVLALSRDSIGVDIETIHRKPHDYNRIVRPPIFSERECVFFRENGCTQDAFYLLWTLKESYMKRTGQGLSQGSCVFKCRSALYSYVPFPEYRLSLCSSERDALFECSRLLLDSELKVFHEPLEDIPQPFVI
ncbi:MAG: 4'-phosphopantetheinyl transferase superfamily protein [Clostridiales bacterium]|nr:4'-phosphopantetheinyl transferase superfamily protein [Clostridiales bacterium]